MPNTTNFNWATPADTDLVKDGAAAIRTLGNSIDSSFVDLKGGTTGQVLTKASNTDLDFTFSSVDPLVILDAKGDLISATAADTPARLASSGVNGDVLTVATGEATGLKWAAPAAGAFTSIASGSLSGASVVLGSIPATYTDLRLDVLDYYASSNAFLELIITGITSNYFGFYVGNEGGTPFGPSTVSTTKVAFKGATANADNNNRAIYYFKNYADTTSRRLISAQDVAIVGGAALALTNAEYTNSSTAAISSLTIAPSAGTFSGGTYVLYGVK